MLQLSESQFRFKIPHQIKHFLPQQLDTRNGSLDGCIYLTEHQVDMLMETMSATTQNDVPQIEIRKLVDLEKKFSQKWTKFPIKYKFDGKHSKCDIYGPRTWYEGRQCFQYYDLPGKGRQGESPDQISRASLGQVGRKLACLPTPSMKEGDPPSNQKDQQEGPVSKYSPYPLTNFTPEFTSMGFKKGLAKNKGTSSRSWTHNTDHY